MVHSSFQSTLQIEKKYHHTHVGSAGINEKKHRSPISIWSLLCFSLVQSNRLKVLKKHSAKAEGLCVCKILKNK